MRFLSKDEASKLRKNLRRQIVDQYTPKLVLYYDSGNHDYSAATDAIAASAGAFTEAVLHVTSWHFGDPENDPRWRRYRQWRAGHGDDRQLYEAPTHCFDRGESKDLSKSLEFALQLGWDALLAASPGRQLMLLSHDDRIEIYRGFGGRTLADKLIPFGYWRRAGSV